MPFKATPLRATPLSATPLSATPLSATPLRATPLVAVKPCASSATTWAPPISPPHPKRKATVVKRRIDGTFVCIVIVVPSVDKESKRRAKEPASSFGGLREQVGRYGV